MQLRDLLYSGGEKGVGTRPHMIIACRLKDDELSPTALFRSFSYKYIFVREPMVMAAFFLFRLYFHIQFLHLLCIQLVLVIRSRAVAKKFCFVLCGVVSLA